MNKRKYKFIARQIESLPHSELFSTQKMEMPTLDPVMIIPDRLVDFTASLQSKVFDAGVHFYLDDYRFERVWKHTEAYLGQLGRFSSVLTPDFSVYTDMPKQLQIRNTYRNRKVGRIFQDAGISVIPTVSWSDENSFEFCFNGLPSHSVVSVSSVGVMRDKGALRLFKMGYSEMLKRLEPSAVLFYGSLPQMELGNVPIRRFDNTNYAWTKKQITNARR